MFLALSETDIRDKNQTSLGNIPSGASGQTLIAGDTRSNVFLSDSESKKKVVKRGGAC